MIDVNVISVIIVLMASFLASWIGVGIFRRWSTRRDLLDIPNDRSSHSTPTPRGGGLVIAVVGLIGYVAISLAFGAHFSWGYFAGALLVAAVSWFDDLYSLPFWSRLLVHIAGGSVLVADLGIWHSFSLPFSSRVVGLGTILGTVVTVGWVVWLLNAYNFMDGIDGIAALQAVIAGVSWALVAFATDSDGVSLFASVIACAALGFLIHNWQPARIFMGDVGSAFLGFTLAAMPLLARGTAATDAPILPLIGILFVWFFVFDTLFTLAGRLIRRERVWEAHRGHLYQKMVIGGMQHSTVTLLYGLAATVLSASVILALLFAGSYTAFSLFLLVLLTLGQVYLGVLKKR